MARDIYNRSGSKISEGKASIDRNPRESTCF